MPLRPTVAEVAEVSRLFERKDPECPRELLKKMVEVLLSKAAVEAVTPSIVEYMELSEIGMGGTLVHLLDFVPTKPVFGAPAGFSGDRHNAYKYSWAHGTDFATARRIVTEGL